MKNNDLLKLTSLSIVAATSFACAPERPSSLKKEYIEPEFKQLISQFEEMYGGPVSGIKIIFKAHQLPTIGMCTIWDYGNRKVKEITIDPEYWNDEGTATEKKIGLMYHELGHCLLERDHVEDRMSQKFDGYLSTFSVPSSLMYPINFYSSFYKSLESYYFTELLFPETRRPL
jgi:hypothetical protein